MKSKKEVVAQEPPTHAEELIESIALIGYRVIVKYCKGETPHPGRAEVWEASLKIADKLVADGLLPECMKRTVNIKGYSFYCRIYHTASMGNLCIPERPGEKTDDPGSGNIILYGLRAYKWRLTRRKAASLILETAKQYSL